MNVLLATAVAASLLLAASAQAQRRAPTEQPSSPDCAAQGALPKEWSGVAYSIDGDTLAGVGLKPHIRLWGTQAPELLDQSRAESVAGMRARAALEDLLSASDHKISCRILKFDRECHVVAQCSLHDGVNPIDIAGAMIAGGMAYTVHLEETLPWEPKASQRYSTAEFEARKNKRGLWPTWLGSK
ncbi:MAG: thermonuclease family protein [Reyranellaceae bacterium]